MRIIPSIIFSLLTYFMMGLQRNDGQFHVFLITILMISLFGSGLCFLVAATIPIFRKFEYNVKRLNVSLLLSCGFNCYYIMPSHNGSILRSYWYKEYIQLVFFHRMDQRFSIFVQCVSYE
jgi:hypothetical protein